MKIKPNDPPRVFNAGKNKNKEVYISDMGDIHLNPNEQVTFVTDSGTGTIFVEKLGFYATSMNSRLKNENFITAMVINKEGFNYIMVVERSKIKEFQLYLKDENLTVVAWFTDPLEKANLKKF